MRSPASENRVMWSASFATACGVCFCDGELGDDLLGMPVENALPDNAHGIVHHRFLRLLRANDFADDAGQAVRKRADVLANHHFQRTGRFAHFTHH